MRRSWPAESAMQAANDITFGRFRLDLTNECLWQGAQAISLRPKAFAVLRLLLQRPGMLVTKQQVLDTVWPGTFVGDAVLKDNIRQLREALEDDAGSPTYIETAHRRGYRFIGQVSEGLTGKAATATQPILSPPELKDAPRTASTNVNAILGREAELAKMQGWLDWALAGESQIVFVTGEPGIGKTTLVEAFLQLASQSSAILVARGQCLEHYGSGEAYLPVLDGFSRLCRSPGGPPVVDLLRQQAPAWLAQMPSVVSQSERENLQTQLVGATRERMLREMADAIETLTSESPLLLVLEDLHWSDYSTLDLVSYLARRRPARLFVIGTYRPVDVILGDHPLKGVKRELQAHGLCHELPLEYLAEEVVEQYLRARFPRHQLPSRLRGAIYRRTEGNPLFMINLVKYLTDQDIIVEEEGTWKLRGELSEVEDSVPANLRQLIEKQIERLTPDERTVLEGASVAGMECSSVAIAAGLNLPVEWVERHCEELARRHQFLSPGWLVELPDGNVTVRYRFVHILYRDVPYRLMPPMRRSQIHHRIAESGVAIYGSRASEITAELAMHFEQSRDWARALEYLLQAAENATRKSAHHEAAGLARRGLEALKPLPKSIELTRQEITLRMILTVSLMATKGFASSEVANFSADGKYVSELSGASPQSFNMLYLVGFSYIMSGNIRPALAIADRLLGLAAKLKDPTLDMEAHRAMGVTLIEQGKCTEALEHLNQASDLYSANRHHPYTLNIGHDCKVLSECFAGRALWTLGFPDAALRRMQGAFAFAKELSHPQSSVGAAHFACELHQLRGEPLLAQLQAREVLKLADEYGLEYWVALGKIDLGWADAELGDLQHGIEQLQQGVAAYQATGGKLWCPRFLSLLACAFGKAARVEEGLTAITEALTMAELNGETYAMPELLRIKGELLLKNTDPPRLGDCPAGDRNKLSAILEAQACFSEAVGIAKQQKTRSWELRAYMSMDRLNTLQGKADHTQLSNSYASFTEGYETADLKQARTLLSAALPS
jgi:DNA-binding winged helix-turn-helix (wHTH) protein/energy-coupling factor transporter ATP-binding protein EcfA2